MRPPSFGETSEGDIAVAAKWIKNQLSDIRWLSEAMLNEGKREGQRLQQMRKTFRRLETTSALELLYYIQEDIQTQWRDVIVALISLQAEFGTQYFPQAFLSIWIQQAEALATSQHNINERQMRKQWRE